MRKYREIEIENIEGTMVQMFPGQSAKEKSLKISIMETVFGTKSWKEITIMNIDKLKKGNSVLKIFKEEYIKQLKSKQEEGLDLSERRNH